MKKIGLIGGITPESTILYYRILNELNSNKLGNPHSAEVVINSFDFGKIAQLQKENRWDLLDEIMAKSGKELENAGATCILICANTMHLCIDAVRNTVAIPVIHIAEATSKKIIEKKLKKVALLGTKYTMEKDFFKDILASFNIEAMIPELEERNTIHTVIYDELAKEDVVRSKYDFSQTATREKMRKLQSLNEGLADLFSFALTGKASLFEHFSSDGESTRVRNFKKRRFFKLPKKAIAKRGGLYLNGEYFSQTFLAKSLKLKNYDDDFDRISAKDRMHLLKDILEFVRVDVFEQLREKSFYGHTESDTEKLLKKYLDQKAKAKRPEQSLYRTMQADSE